MKATPDPCAGRVTASPSGNLPCSSLFEENTEESAFSAFPQRAVGSGLLLKDG